MPRRPYPFHNGQRNQSLNAERWTIDYGNLVVECRDEADAKSLCRKLSERRNRLVARSVGGPFPNRRLEGDDLELWLISPALENQRLRNEAQPS